MPREELFKGIKVVGFVTFIPFMLAAGPLTGYFVGTFLVKHFHFSFLCVVIGVLLGFLAAVTEIIKIVKAIQRVNKNE